MLFVSVCRPEILKQEIKVFFVKYNDPIYVKLEKLDIMIRLASQANIAQVTSVTLCLSFKFVALFTRLECVAAVVAFRCWPS